MNKLFNVKVLPALMAFALLFTGSAHAILITDFEITPSSFYDFDPVTNNHGGDGSTVQAIGEALFVGVSASGGSVLFEFLNTNSDGSIAQIYFDDDGGLLMDYTAPAVHSYSAFGPDFAFGGVSPGNLPGGATLDPDFVADVGLSAGAGAPSSPSGIESDEWLVLSFTGSLASVESAIADGSLRIGLHVISLGELSEGFVNGDPDCIPTPENNFCDSGGPPPSNPEIPEPASVVLLGLGLAGVVASTRRFRPQF